MEEIGEKENQTKTGCKANTISNEYLEIYGLLAECWIKGCSFRLLSALMRTKRYDTVYDALVRGKAFPGIKRSRPSRDEQQNIAGIPESVLQAMESHKITVRKWCQAYGVDHVDLWYLINPDGSEATVATLLKEDFPELFEMEPRKYETTPVGCDRQKFFSVKKGRHVFWSNYYNIRVEHHKESEGLRIFNWRKSQVVIKRRLRLLLKDGIEAALSWPPSELKVYDKKTGEKKWVLVMEPEEAEFQQKIFEMLKRDEEINTMIRKLAALPSRYMSDAQVDQKRLMWEQLINTYEMTPEQIINEIKRLRWKVGRY